MNWYTFLDVVAWGTAGIGIIASIAFIVLPDARRDDPGGSRRAFALALLSIAYLIARI